jgi:acylphosphatase
MKIARNIRVEGQVQGVFFRDWVVKTACGLHVTGWVRNRHDGSVEVMAVGETDIIGRFVEYLRKGSPSSRVERIVVDDAAMEEFTGFARRATA